MEVTLRRFGRQPLKVTLTGDAVTVSSVLAEADVSGEGMTVLVNNSPAGLDTVVRANDTVTLAPKSEGAN